MCLLPSLNTRLIPQFKKMKPGSRIVLHAYNMLGIKSDKVVMVKFKEDNATHAIYL